MLDYESLELVYDVVRDLIQALEQDWSEGRLDAHRTEVLSGCYLVCDYTANKLAFFNCEDDEAEDQLPIKESQYRAVLSIMKECENGLEGDLADDSCKSFIDYRKVNALVGFRTIIPYIDELTKILNTVTCRYRSALLNA